MQVRQLMARSSVVHKCALLDLVGQLINHVALVGEHGPNIIFLLLSTYEKNLVLTLNGSEFLGQNFSVSDRNFYCCLGVQLMNEQTFLLLVVVVQARFDRSKDVIWLERNHIMEETSKFVYF